MTQLSCPNVPSGQSTKVYWGTTDPASASNLDAELLPYDVESISSADVSRPSVDRTPLSIGPDEYRCQTVGAKVGGPVTVECYWDPDVDFNVDLFDKHDHYLTIEAPTISGTTGARVYGLADLIGHSISAALDETLRVTLTFQYQGQVIHEPESGVGP